MSPASRSFVWALQGLALILVLGLMALLAMAAWTVYRHDIRIFSVQSGSMSPAINTGDMIVTKKVAFDAMAVGDVISYRPMPGGAMTTHRIHSIDTASRRVATKGDTNPQADGFIASRQIEGKAIAYAPGAGRLTGVLRSPAGLIGLIYLPATVIIVGEVRRFERKMQKPYRLSGYEGSC